MGDAVTLYVFLPGTFLFSGERHRVDVVCI